jgi:hypothetical protein
MRGRREKTGVVPLRVLELRPNPRRPRQEQDRVFEREREHLAAQREPFPAQDAGRAQQHLVLGELFGRELLPAALDHR